MIPFDKKICEEIELQMSNQPEQKNAQTLANTAALFMTEANGELQNNLYKWSDDKIRTYGLRLTKYSNVVQSFISIRNGRTSFNIINAGIRDATDLYIEINLELLSEWNSANDIRRGEIISEVLLPDRLFIRFLEKHKQDE
jgi:hypothetical protein